MMRAKDIMMDDTVIPVNNDDELLSMARAFLMASGDAKVAMARAMLEIMNT
ncbi:MAG: hypothetical protein GXO25_05005 [Euryarchaeota archaeon]|nr:hypothetical protein [Euryarchaeota archaeon]